MQREMDFDGEKVTLFKHLDTTTYFRVTCPLCKQDNWHEQGRFDFTAFKCAGCGGVFMEDDEDLIDITEHEGLEIAECVKTP